MPLPAWLPTLQRKLLRDLWHIKGQALAITLVIAASVGMYVMSKGMLLSLNQTRSDYYAQHRFAQIYAPVKRAPRRLRAAALDLAGVRQADARIRVGVLMDVEGVVAPISAQLLSLPAGAQPAINAIALSQGRLTRERASNEIVLLESFALAHGLAPGDRIQAILNGKQRRLDIVGLALSPEFVYAISPGEIVPDSRRFGVGWMDDTSLAEAFDLDEAFNELLLLTDPDRSSAELISRLDQWLRPYGATGAYTRSEQLSDRFLSNEIEQLDVMGYLLPPIFLLVAGFLLHVVLTRLIETEREQIGLIKAFGYSHFAVAGHYLQLAGLITLAGIVLGSVLGQQLGQGLASLYQDYFKFPYLRFAAPLDVYGVAAGISMLAALLGCGLSLNQVLRLSPAVAMAPPLPPDYSRGARHLQSLLRNLDQPSRMILRHLLRWPVRAGLTCAGMAMAMGLLIGSSFSLDAMDYMIDASFNIIEPQDASVVLVEPRQGEAARAMQQLPGVLLAEPYRAVPVVLRHRHRHRRETLIGLPAQADLSRLVDADLRRVELPHQGLILSRKLAELLMIEPGDLLEIEVTEGHRPQLRLPVAGIVESFLGTGAYMEMGALNRSLREDHLISGIRLLLDPARSDEVYQQIKAMPGVAGISLQQAAQKAFYDTLQESLGTFTFFNTLFAALIAIGVVYNSARVALSERGRELASLRVLGLSRGEVSYILLGELALLCLLSLPLGALLGYALAAFLVHSFDTDLFRIPLIIHPSTYAYAALVIIVAATLSAAVVRRRIDRLDLIGVLKTRE